MHDGNAKGSKHDGSAERQRSPQDLGRTGVSAADAGMGQARRPAQRQRKEGEKQ